MPVIKSKIDESVNFITQTKSGLFESRYVRRGDKAICYLSTHTGCNLSCRFCHLTQTGQTRDIKATVDEVLLQAKKVVDYYKKQPKAEVFHFNFMARGDFFDNEILILWHDELFHRLNWLVREIDLDIKIVFNISTILPERTRKLWPMIKALQIGRHFDTRIYYSFYSSRNEFRKKWMPKAADTAEVNNFNLLSLFPTCRIRLHQCFIDSWNTDDSDIEDLKTFSWNNGATRINIVRYNPYSEGQGKEASEEFLNYAVKELSEDFSVKLIPRVGEDVYASCGMFITPEKL